MPQQQRRTPGAGQNRHSRGDLDGEARDGMAGTKNESPMAGGHGWYPFAKRHPRLENGLSLIALLIALASQIRRRWWSSSVSASAPSP